MPGLLTISQAAKLLGRHPMTVRGYCNHEDLPHQRVGVAGRIMIDPKDLAEWQSRPETAEMLAHGNLIKGRPVTA